MKKIVLLIFSLILLLILLPSWVLAQLTPSVSVTLLDVNPTSVIEGEEVRGILRVSVVCPVSINVVGWVNFGDGDSRGLGTCECIWNGVIGEASKVNCDFDFSHIYNLPGGVGRDYTIVPIAVASGPVSAGAVSAPVTIHVSPAPSPAPGPGTGNPLISTTTAGLISTVTNVVYIIIYALTVLFLMLGGFLIITSAGNPEQVVRGRKIVLYTIIAFVILIIARGILILLFRIFDIPVQI